jgi:predicted anti-sigma-YlaC factor YlaD
MKNMSCEDIEKILVDYSDDLLSNEEKSQVEQHLDNCEKCQKLLKALEHSLELSNVIWEDNLSDIEKDEIASSPNVRKIPLLRYVSIAASILVIVTTGILLSSLQKPKENPEELTFEQIEKKINDSGSAAYLLAATELLEEYPDYKEIAESQYHYIAKTFQGTPAAEKIKSKIQ